MDDQAAQSSEEPNLKGELGKLRDTIMTLQSLVFEHNNVNSPQEETNPESIRKLDNIKNAITMMRVDLEEVASALRHLA